MIALAGDLRDTEWIDAARRWATNTGRRRGASGLAVGARALVGEKGGAVASVQRPVLAGKKISAAVFAHGDRADRAVGLVCRHFGKQALTKERY